MAEPDARRAPPFRNLESQSGRTTGAPTGGWFAVPFAIRLWIALVFVIGASVLTITQSPRPDAFRRPPAFLSLSWWRYPLEWNAPSRLPKIGVSLNAIQVAPNTSHVWAVGRQGMVVVSTDGGQTWSKKTLADQQRATENLIAVSFDDASTGRVLGERATSFSTKDGGESWGRIDYALELKRVSGIKNMDLTVHGYLATGASYPPDFVPPDITLLRLTSAFLPPNQGYPVWFTTQDSELIGLVTVPWDPQPYLYSVTPIEAASVLDKYYGWAIDRTGAIHRTENGGSTWERLPPLPPFPFRAEGVFFADPNRGWVVGSYGTVYKTTDGGQTWQSQESGTKSGLKAGSFLPDAQNGWIAGEHGLILSTHDGGATWVHRTQGNDASGSYLRFPAPWFFLFLLVVPLLLLRRASVPASEPEESVADVLVSDRPLDTSAGDVLAFNTIALGLSRFLRNENTSPPLTVAIIGEWGTGKSSLMNLLRADLRSYKFRPVWFNAWHHQKEEHMLASLLENIKLQAVPRWWSNRGLAFRAKLLGIRGWRHWLPLVLLLFFIYVLLIYHFGREGTDASYAGLTNWLAAAVSHPLEAVSRLVPLAPLLAGIFTFLGALWRGITAFGVKPASLLAGVSAGASIRGLEAQTSFRQKFAVEFNDVTRALGNRSLLIFIDDLDRCRPENVLETLEAVNFLTTSGECFVVIGMAREYVERCVGRAFKDIAEEMIDDVDKRQSNGEDQTPDELAKEKRIEFARQYLDKLINIEVPIPAAKQGQSLNLLLAGAYQTSEPEPKSGWEEFKSSAAGVLARHWRVLPALTALVVLLTLGYFLAMSLIGQTAASPTTASVMAATTARATIIAAVEINLVATASPPQPSTPSRSAAASSPTPTPTALPSPSPTAEILNERAEIIAGGRGLFSRNLLPALALLAMLWIGVTVLTRRPDLVVKDSPNFVDALKIWHPLIFSRQSTPRSIKRFMNRIRYLAMRQRAVSEGERSWWRRLVRSSGVPKEVPPEAAASAAGNPVDPIPDEVLVALAAIEHFDRSMFVSMTSAQASAWPSTSFEVRTGVKIGHPANKLPIQAREAHEKRFGNFDVLKYRDRFVEMAASVEVR